MMSSIHVLRMRLFFIIPLQPLGKITLKDGVSRPDKFIFNRQPRKFSKLNCEAALALASEEIRNLFF